MTVREFHSCLRDGKRYSLPNCPPVYFVAVLCCVEVVSVSVRARSVALLARLSAIVVTVSNNQTTLLHVTPGFKPFFVLLVLFTF